MRRGASVLVAMLLFTPAGCSSLIPIPTPPRDVEVPDPGWTPDAPDGRDPGIDSPDPGRRDAEVAEDPGELVPYDSGCVLQCFGKVCGDDGCDGTCGICPSGTTCSSDGYSCIVQAVQAPLGGACGPTADCQAVIAIAWQPGLGIANPSWPGCLDDQCREGPCVAGACSRSCALGKDDVQNGTGVPVPDGIDDDDAPGGGCDGALDSLFSGPWACVEADLPGGSADPAGRCVPRSSFTPCPEGGACPAGEACGFLQVRGNLEAHCLAERKDGGGLADLCGWDERLGAARGCRAWSCSGRGCTAPCATDGDCRTASARCDTVAGTCEGTGTACAADADCSAWSCQQGVQVDDPAGLFTACAPRTCRSDPECRDPDFYCEHDVALMVASLPTDPPGRCARKVIGGGLAGATCNSTPDDGRPDLPCADEAYCLDGRCGALCVTGADCAPGQRCGLRDLLVDVSGDGRADLSLQVSLCLTTGDPAPSCSDPGDCGDGTACTPFVPAEADPPAVDLACMSPPPDSLPVGSACGAAAFGATCGTRSCLFEDAVNGVAGICSEPCRTAADCPESSTSGTGTVRWTCEALAFSAAGTRVSSDDLWVSWCVPVPGDSSLAPCDEAPSCPDPGEFCRPSVRSGAPGGIDEVRWFCVRPWEGGAPGATCDPARNGADCATRMCEPTVLDGVGFCSLGCRADGDCSLLAGWGAVCAPRVVVPRTDRALSVTVPLCRQVGTCVDCRTDLDCAPDLRCVDASAVPYLRDWRCAKPCEDDAACAAEPQGTTCTEVAASYESSASGRAKACLPITCP